MLLLLETMNSFYIYAESHWKYHTFEGYYICSFSKLRHKVNQKVRKCSLTFPLGNGIVTFYENCTNSFIHSFIHSRIYIAPLQENYSEVLPTPARSKRTVFN